MKSKITISRVDGATLAIALSLFYILFQPYGWFLLVHVWLFILIFLFFALISKKINLKTFSYVNILSCLFLIYCIFSIFFVGSYEGSIKILLYHIVEIITLIVFINYKFSVKDFKFILKSYEIATYLVVLKMLIQHTTYSGTSSRYTIVNFGKAMDVNFLAASLIAPAIILFYKCQKNNFRFAYILQFFIVLLGIVFTGSRGGVLAVVLGCLIVYKDKLKLTKKSIGYICLIVFAALITIMLLPESITGRFSIDSLNDSSNVFRWRLWKAAFELFLSNPIFGRGSNSIYALGYQYGGVTGMSSHNFVLEILTDYGLIGLFLIGNIIYCAFKVNRKNNLGLGILISSLVAACILPALDSTFFWMNLMISFVIGKLDKKLILKDE